MDAGIVGSLITLLFFLVFVAIIWWAYSTRNKDKFEAAGRLPFEEDPTDDNRHARQGETK